MNRFLISLIAIILGFTNCAFASMDSIGRKKMIEFGWDMQYPSFVRDNIRDMEKRPFDGTVLKLEYKGGLIFNSKTKWDESELKKDLEAIKDMIPLKKPPIIGCFLKDFRSRRRIY